MLLVVAGAVGLGFGEGWRVLRDLRERWLAHEQWLAGVEKEAGMEKEERHD